MRHHILARVTPLVLLGLAAAGCVTESSSNERFPQPGYVWCYPNNPGDFSVRWQQGIAYTERGTVTRPHIQSAPQQGSWYPASGYRWVHLDQNGNAIPGQLDVVWEQGRAFVEFGVTTQPHLISASQEGRWWPMPGYIWSKLDAQGNQIPGEMGVYWQAGRAYWESGVNKFPHIVSSTQEGKWWPSPGYEWSKLDAQGKAIPGELEVRWKQGKTYWEGGVQKHPNLRAAKEEGQWWPAPGYTWAKKDEKGNPIRGELSVQWDPGRAHFDQGVLTWPHVVAHTSEGNWIPEDGYTWLHLDRNGKPIPGDLAVGPEAELEAARAQESELQTRWGSYLQQIQSQNDYSHWSSPPHDLFKSR